MRTETTWSFLAGFVVGGVTVALLDPRRGAARRAVLRDKSMSAANTEVPVKREIPASIMGEKRDGICVAAADNRRLLTGRDQ